MQTAGFNSIQFIGYGSAVRISFKGDEADPLRDCFYFSVLERGINIGRQGFLFMNLAHNDALVDRVIEAVSGFVAGVVAGGDNMDH
jgi:glutamate-1-semialdehyde 2,1-aminomutase